MLKRVEDLLYISRRTKEYFEKNNMASNHVDFINTVTSNILCRSLELAKSQNNIRVYNHIMNFYKNLVIPESEINNMFMVDAYLSISGITYEYELISKLLDCEDCTSDQWTKISISPQIIYGSKPVENSSQMSEYKLLKQEAALEQSHTKFRNKIEFFEKLQTNPVPDSLTSVFETKLIARFMKSDLLEQMPRSTLISSELMDYLVGRYGTEEYIMWTSEGRNIKFLLEGIYRSGRIVLVKFFKKQPLIKNLYGAIKSGSLQLVEYAEKHLVNRIIDKRAAFVCACRSGNTALVEKYMEGACGKGFFIAARQGHDIVIKWLAEKKHVDRKKTIIGAIVGRRIGILEYLFPGIKKFD